MNIPIFRAKKIDSNAYVLGWLLQDCFGYYIIPTNNALRCESLNSESIEIDPTTLAIHFPDMKDSKRNKIFASLQEDGKGGDIVLEPHHETEIETVLSYENYIKNIDKRAHTILYSKIIGVQE